jgi:hypothetical protein|tara:strand:+ start:1550 stop:2005 length:456 start_codon:yes stop_codon:yes gene_type:complete
MTIIKKVFFIMLLFTLGNCGYEPMHLKKRTINTKIQNFQLEGNKSINKRIISSLGIKNQGKTSGYKLVIKSNKSLETVAKNAAGDAAIYKTTITVIVSIMDGNKVVKDKNLISDFTYNNKENKFDLSQYQKEIEENLINKIIEKINIFLIF